MEGQLKKLCRRISRQCTEGMAHLNLAQNHSREFIFDRGAIVEFSYLRQQLLAAEEAVKMASEQIKQFCMEHGDIDTGRREGGAH